MTINRRAMTEAEELFSASRTLQQLSEWRIISTVCAGSRNYAISISCET